MAKNKKLTLSQIAIIRESLQDKSSLRKITEKILNSQPDLTKSAIKNQWLIEREFIAKKKMAKREGAEMIRKFLESKSPSTKVEDMAALLETAIYRDLLRRYLEADDFMKISTDQILKLGMNYRRLNQSRYQDNETAIIKKEEAIKIALETVNTIKPLLKDRSSFDSKSEKELIATLKKRFDSDEFERILEHEQIIEKIRDINDLQNENKIENEDQKVAGRIS